MPWYAYLALVFVWSVVVVAVAASIVERIAESLRQMTGPREPSSVTVTLHYPTVWEIYAPDLDWDDEDDPSESAAGPLPLDGAMLETLDDIRTLPEV